MKKIFLALLLPALATAQTYTASPIDPSLYGTYPYNFTGAVRSSKGMGSGAVVRNARLVYSCAHVVFDSTKTDPWLTGIRWYRSYNSSTYPSTTGGQLLRSYYFFTGYATAANFSSSAPSTYALDFVVHYAYENTANGGYGGFYSNGTTMLQSSYQKMITGYPAGLYSDGDTRQYRMHKTGPFTRAATVSSGDYVRLSEVSTGSGNSGGPIWINNGSDWYFAGVLVSGLERSVGASSDSAGIYAVDFSADSLIEKAITDSTDRGPTITAQPSSRRVSAGDPVTFTVLASGPNLSYQWYGNNDQLIPGETSATYGFISTKLTHAGTYYVIVSNAIGQVRSATVILAVDSAPIITTQPTNLTIGPNENVTFAVLAVGTAPITYQWKKDGAAIPGATSAFYTITKAQLAHAGSYTVTLTNSFGTITSNPSILSLGTPPIITSHPVSQTVNAGRPTALSVTASGVPSPVYQWKFYGNSIAGATNASFNISRSEMGDAGAYAVTVSNAYGTVTSSTANLNIAINRLVNLSVLTDLSEPNEEVTIGFVTGGSGTSGSKPLVIRAAGPSLAPLGVANTLEDPKLEVYSGIIRVGTNDNWGGITALANAMASVGAFAFTGPTSKDAATALSLAHGANSARISSINQGAGAVIAELYDANPWSTLLSTTPRLVNISVLKEVRSGFTAGFVVQGTYPKSVLVRAIGPSLLNFAIPNPLVDPHVVLRSAQNLVTSNDNWGGTQTLTSTFTNVGAFAIPSTSKDAALLVSLNPGNYTVLVGGVMGFTGQVLLEIYEVP
jgi:hypothetical protein